ncbi:MAG: SUF system NifU family Fe-S cluster assembly protein [Gammaproteobacteria bacterium RBG_16_51_14]|nr:MAG: SUF system NifU family Fe-S cluster assembly protein [Gammaproteobacteria bacterium RBG_16_51_14]
MTFDLRDLYQEVIVDHNRNPKNFGKMENATRVAEGYNPLCGDKLHLYLKTDNDRIDDVSFDGTGCAISVASASLMTEALKGKTFSEAEQIFRDFHKLVTQDVSLQDSTMQQLGKLAVLAGVREFPTRVKCATLCWHTLHSILEGTETTVSTE